ncbi:uncharacterized protein BJX67DRAFT_167838 [Aspergillus lucknowensis]|uniref:Uncharacterized protein n=1 Tax=Aspergillus lucknowensis TaxID=176173 RepID=A0ABR4M574_9EURO
MRNAFVGDPSLQTRDSYWKANRQAFLTFLFFLAFLLAPSLLVKEGRLKIGIIGGSTSFAPQPSQSAVPVGTRNALNAPPPLAFVVGSGNTKDNNGKKRRKPSLEQ